MKEHKNVLRVFFSHFRRLLLLYFLFGAVAVEWELLIGWKNIYNRLSGEWKVYEWVVSRRRMQKVEVGRRRGWLNNRVVAGAGDRDDI